MDANWRSSTVVALCNEVRKTGDYSTLPVLSDALQDAGCEDAALIAQLQDGGLGKIQAQRLVCLLLGGETAEAVLWVDEFAKGFVPDEEDNRTFGYTDLFEMARDDDVVTQYNGTDWQEHFYSHASEFWEKYALITGTSPRDERRWDNLFSCDC